MLRYLPVFILLPLFSAQAGKVDYARDIQPILSENCYHCHGPDEHTREADLRLDTKEGAFRTADGITVVKPGDSKQSELVIRVFTSDEEELMPTPKSKRTLTQKQKDLLKQWVDEGAEWSDHWAYTAPRRPDSPKPEGYLFQNPIDGFVAAKLQEKKLPFSPEATRQELIRRVSLDLTGIPPTPAEVDAFVADTALDAYEKLVDRLLASPRYGERMVWEWLDAARYSDTNGYQFDNTRAMWIWRDWAIRAMNSNMPFDQFTIEQIAGDLLPDATQDQKIATAFNRNHMINGEGGRIAEENRIEYLVDQTDTISTVWLGVTLGCARCHDHKYDPFTQKEYYQMMAFLNQTPVTGGDDSGHAAPVLDMSKPEEKAKLEELDAAFKKVAAEIHELEKKLFPREEGRPVSASPKAAGFSANIVGSLDVEPEKRTGPPLHQLVRFFEEQNPEYGKALLRLKEAFHAKNDYDESLWRVMVMKEADKKRDTFVLGKGSYDRPGEKVVAGFPAVLQGGYKLDENPNRLSLARWLVARENPLTARVTVNRYWQTFFGSGIVENVENFGLQTEIPLHHDLLDWLAVEFMESGWNAKALHKLIVMSATYRQSSRVTPAHLEADPLNKLMSRGARFRMPSWMLRDQALAVSGLLVEKSGGPPVKGYQPEGLWEDASFGMITYKQDHGEALYRRSLYTFWRRIIAPPLFFDTASRQTCVVKALRTNTPLHALTTLNDIAYIEAARVLAESLLKTKDIEENSRIAAAMKRAIGRVPSDEEAVILRESLAKYRKVFESDTAAANALLKIGEAPRDPSISVTEHAAWTNLCNLILNLDETLTKE